MVQRTVLKVDISCQKCKKKILKAVSTLDGVDKIEVDEGKGTLIVTGNVDPYEVIVRTRKAGKHAEVVSIGPPPAPPKQPQPQDAQKKPDDNKKPDQKKPEIHFNDHLNYPPRIVFVPMAGYDSYNQPNPSCSIM
ncbi:heavy metal-associated isoprenylated plant protein 43-like [Euphorbia lathyris]|uniref:heavy metal-associated isoprenylated plant protein 43-like n=1 Tax=Euphorbia lathyris TaxID=212925 RepID=UPI00331350AF